METRTRPHPDCPDCTMVALDNGRSVAAGIRLCAAHKAESERTLAAARAANPEIDALHRMLEGYRARRA